MISKGSFLNSEGRKFDSHFQVTVNVSNSEVFCLAFVFCCVAKIKAFTAAQQ